MLFYTKALQALSFVRRTRFSLAGFFRLRVLYSTRLRFNRFNAFGVSLGDFRNGRGAFHRSYHFFQLWSRARGCSRVLADLGGSLGAGFFVLAVVSVDRFLDTLHHL